MDYFFSEKKDLTTKDKSEKKEDSIKVVKENERELFTKSTQDLKIKLEWLLEIRKLRGEKFFKKNPNWQNKQI